MGLAASLSKAQRIILSGQVKVFHPEKNFPYPPSQIKPGNLFAENVKIEIASLPKYVSRGGDKLEPALKFWNIRADKKVCLDIGCSTGGFTDCLLQNGAEMVYAVDVGHGQLHPKLRNDPRVHVYEENHILKWVPPWIKTDEKFPSLITIDLSFISLTRILKKVAELVAGFECELLVLIKPQFEADEKHIKKGIVKDETIRRAAIHNIIEKSINLGYKVNGHFSCPVLGAKGNREEWLSLRMCQKSP